MPRSRRSRSTKNSRAKDAHPSDELPPRVDSTPAPQAEIGQGAPPANPLEELTAAEQRVEAEFPPLPPPRPAGAPVNDNELAAGAEELAEEFAKRPELIELLDAEELAATYDLAFGFVAEQRGLPHWELPPKSALRLGNLTRRLILKHPELAQWLAHYLAEALLVLVLCLEVGTRIVKDRKLTEAKLPAPPAEGATP